MDQYSYIANSEAAYIDQLYQSFKQDPASVDGSWQQFFKGFEFSLAYGEPTGSAKPAANGTVANGTTKTTPADSERSEKEISVASLIKAYRSRGHLLSKTNPIGQRKDRNPRLGLADYALTDADLDTVFEAGKLLGIGAATLRKIMESLETIYAGRIEIGRAHV